MSEFKGLTNSDLDLLGFRAFNHFTVGEQSKYQLSRKRHLSAMCVGTCNESFWLCQKNETGEISDLICVHNYDRDGFITNEKIKALIEWFDGECKALRGAND